jgi:hypothetical protein
MEQRVPPSGPSADELSPWLNPDIESAVLECIELSRDRTVRAAVVRLGGTAEAYRKLARLVIEIRWNAADPLNPRDTHRLSLPPKKAELRQLVKGVEVALDRDRQYRGPLAGVDLEAKGSASKSGGVASSRRLRRRGGRGSSL